MSTSKLRNGWRIVWLICVYDCPMTEREERRDYTLFRKQLLKQNFLQLQYSLYSKSFSNQDKAMTMIEALQPHIPAGASVAFFFVTDKQWGMTRDYYGPKKSKKPIPQYEQISLF